ncbi:PRC-barrel domain-containing protein [Billgrantia saliphila]|uniref:PRC-barrel domain-containing protein n=1 Tax=Billgrantia saliphila TaxID=1848458 RepID=UPI0018CC7338|nr:PRC-barrel domain-containing protein [Halomonas saliphila]
MQKRLLTIAVAAVTGSLAFGTQAVAQEDDAKAAQGLYSADDIIGADVYLQSDPDEDVGDVSNILLDDEQKVSKVVITTGEILGMGGREIVADVEELSLETERDDGDTTHRILINAESEDLEGYPEYSEEWFDTEREKVRTEGTSAWQTGTVGAGSDMGNQNVDENDDSAELTEEDVETDFE